MAKIGYNINHNTVTNPQREEIYNTDADLHLVMCQSSDDHRQMQVWKDNLGAEHIVWRKWDKREGDWKDWTEEPDNHEIVLDWLNSGHLDIIRDDPTNEPSLDGYNVNLNKRYVERCVDLLEQASAVGITLAIGAFSVGLPHERLISEGIYDDLIRAVVEGGHYISVHEYCPGIPGAGDTFAYDELLDPETVADAMYPFQWGLDEYWLLRRSDRFVIRARQLELSDPQIFITECFIDDIGDVNYTLGHTVWDAMKDKYAIPGHTKLKGVLSWRSYYADAFPDMTYGEAVTYLTRYLVENVYSVPWIKGVNLFSINANWDSKGHNWGNAQLDNFRRFALPEINQAIEPAPPIPQDLVIFPDNDDPHWTDGTFSTQRLNFRTQPYVHSTTKITRLEGDYKGRINREHFYDGDTWRWIPIQIDNVEFESHGWIAEYEIGKEDTKYFEFIPDTPPEPEPPQDDDSVLLTKDMAKAIAECYLAMYQASKKLYEIFAELGGVLTANALDEVMYSNVAATDGEVATTLAAMLDDETFEKHVYKIIDGEIDNTINDDDLPKAG